MLVCLFFVSPLAQGTSPPAIEFKVIHLNGKPHRFLWIARWHELLSAGCHHVTGKGKGKVKCVAFDVLKKVKLADLPPTKVCLGQGGSPVQAVDAGTPVTLCRFGDNSMTAYRSIEAYASKNSK